MSLTLATPVAGLLPGPATEVTVKDNLNIDLDDTRDDVKIELHLNAANALVARLPAAQATVAVADELDPQPWPYTLILGATLLASRWVKRGNSPAGVIDLGGDAGVAYVQRTDPDIAQLLEIGPYARPSVG